MWSRGKKKWPRRWSRRSAKISTARIPSSIARVRRQWVTLYSDATECLTRCLPWSTEDPACQLGVTRIELLDTQSVQTLFGDNLKVVALKGDAWMRPVFTPPDICTPFTINTWLTYAERVHITMRAGLIKQRVAAGQLEGLQYNPLSGFDWSEAPWRREWTHVWPAKGRDVTRVWHPEGSFLGTYGDVTKNSVSVPGWTLGSGSGNWLGYTEPAISTFGREQFAGEEDCFQGAATIRGTDRPWYRMPLSSRRVHTLKESDDLSIFLNMSSVAFQDEESCTDPECDTFGYAPCQIQLQLNVKALIQYG